MKISKNRKALYITGCAILAVAMLLAVYFVLLGTGVIHGREQIIVIKANSAEKIYDGEPLTCSEWEILKGEVRPGHTMHIYPVGEQTEPGKSENQLRVTIEDSLGADVSDDYHIEYVPGTLTVYAQELKLKSINQSQVYNGHPLKANPDGWEILSGGVLDGHTLSVTMNASITEIGSCENLMDVIITDKKGTDVTSLYKISLITGSLTIYPYTLKLQSGNETKYYDGEPLTNHTYQILGGELQSGHRLEIDYSGEITEVGYVDNAYIVRIYDEQNNDVTNQYYLDCLTGTLVILPARFWVESGSAWKVYDGLPLVYNKYQIISGGPVNGDTYEVIVTGSQTEIGSSNNTTELHIYDKDGNDVSANYSIEIFEGTLVVYEVIPDPDDVPDNMEHVKPEISDDPDAPDVPINPDDPDPDNPDVPDVPVNPNPDDPNPDNPDVPVNPNPDDPNPDNPDVPVNPNPDDPNPDNPDVPVNPNPDNPDQGGDDSGSSSGGSGGGSSGGGGGGGGGSGSGSDGEGSGDGGSGSGPGGSGSGSGGEGEGEGGSGSGGGGGGGGDEGEEPEEKKILWVKSEKSGKFYLSAQVFGDYAGGNLYDAPVYSNNAMTINPLSFAAIAAQQVNPEVFVVDIACNFQNQVLAYYALNGYMHASKDANIKSTDVAFDMDCLTYSFEELGTILLPEEYVALEQQYRAYTHANYIAVPDELNALFSVLMPDIGIMGELTDEDIIRIAEFVRSYEGYRYADQMGKNHEDPMAMFVAGQRLGKAEEYAIFATMLYRYYGIPARTVVGYAIDINEADVWYDDIDAEDVYYWIEIYIDGMGWVMMDVSGNIPPQHQEPGPETELDKENSEDQNRLFFRVKTDIAEYLYFRGQSYGDYTGTGWTSAPTSVNGFNATNPLYLAGHILQANGLSSHEVQVEWVMNSMGIFSPYYTVDGLQDCILDTHINIYDQSYTLQYIPYNIYGSIDGQESLIDLEGVLALREEALRNHAYQHYLSVPDNVREVLQRLADENGLNVNDRRFVQNVAAYIQNAAKYNLDFAPFPADEDMIIYFLTEGKEGICQHYASAATLMFRTLGVPARYVTGFTCETIPGEWTDVKEPGHAWVEVYINGLGWIPVEVTGSAETDPDEIVEITVFPPDDDMKLFDGKPLTPTDVRYQGKLKPGHQIDKESATFIGSITYPGACVSSIDQIRIVDEQGNDVSDQYKINRKDGMMQIFYRTVRVITDSAWKKYDGTPLTAHDYTYSNYAEATTPIDMVMAEGHRLDFQFDASITDYGIIDNTIAGGVEGIKVYDAEGNDVTAGYSFQISNGKLQIYYDKLVYKTPNVTKEYDGLPLMSEGGELISGQLMPGHRIEMFNFASLTNVGQITNSFSYRIYDENGQDITTHYRVEFDSSSKLIITPRLLYVESKSAEKVHDGLPLICHEFILRDSEMNEYELASTLEIHVTFNEKATLTNIGQAVNGIKSVIIYRINGQSEPKTDVTANFTIEYIEGLLQVKSA